MRQPQRGMGRFAGDSGYRKGRGTPGVLGLGLYWQDLLLKDQAADIPWKAWSREAFPTVEEDQVWEHLNRLH